MTLIHVTTIDEFKRIVEESPETQLVVVDFYADWCPPCRAIGPFFEGLSSRYPDAIFIKVNVDQSRDISHAYGIRAMPTFLFIKGGEVVQRLQGADQEKILESMDKYYSQGLTYQERHFLDKLSKYSATVDRCEDDTYIALARSVIPLEELTENATIDKKVNKIFLMQGLLSWFKHDFFKWCDKPDCQKCGDSSAMMSAEMKAPTSEELQFGALRVEAYVCSKCGLETRFPRYNDPIKLLETRTGRCGEWANCFTLISTAAGFESRYIVDTTDHVWTEVFLENRWIHCDSCENLFDKPLVYAIGWKKQLKYVVAYGLDHVADVTWKYVPDAKKAFTDRHEIRDNFFLEFIANLNKKIATKKNISKERIQELKLRRLVELFTTVISDRNLGSDSYGGRISGSEEWKKSRKEDGDNIISHFVIDLSSDNEENPISFQYNCAADTYTSPRKVGFEKLAFECTNIMRKTEQDWKKVYLCRENGKIDGSITWKFDLKNKTLKRIEISIRGITTFDNGSVSIVACLGDLCMLTKNGTLTIDCPTGDYLKITATLSGGTGETAFQHAQLFRSDINEQAASMEICFHM